MKKALAVGRMFIIQYVKTEKRMLIRKRKGSAVRKLETRKAVGP